MNGKYPYKPDKTITVNGWIIDLFSAECIANVRKKHWNNSIVIRDSTDDIKRLPKSVIAVLSKCGFMEKWKTRKIENSLKKLNEISAKIEKLKTLGLWQS